MGEPRFLRAYADRLYEIGIDEFLRWYDAPVLVGVSLYGQVSREGGRATAAIVGDQSMPAGSILDRVWPLVKAAATNDPHYVVVGQRSDCDVVIQEYTLSTRHCAFTADRDKPLRVADLGSLNGTRLDGTMLPKRELTPVRDGALLVLGRLGVQCFTAEGFAARLRSF